MASREAMTPRVALVLGKSLPMMLLDPGAALDRISPSLQCVPIRGGIFWLRSCSKISGSEVFFKYANPNPVRTPKTVSATKNHIT